MSKQRTVLYPEVRFSVAILLFAAAALKVHFLSTNVLVVGETVFSSRRAQLLISQFELLISLLLFFDFWALHLKCFLILLFTALSLYAGWNSFFGIRCGCLGQVTPSPTIIVVINVAVLLLLVFFKPQVVEAKTMPEWKSPRFLVAVVIALTVGLPAAYISEFATFAEEDHVQFIDPSKFTKGGPFPLTEHIETDEAMDSGWWLVVLFKKKCPRCKNVPKECERRAELWAHQQNKPKILLVEIPAKPSKALTASFPSSPQTFVKHGRLDGQYKWHCRETPMFLSVHNGRFSGSSPSLSLSLLIQEKEYAK